MSAFFLMCRIAILVLALAALAPRGLFAAQAKAHHNAATATVAHRASATRGAVVARIRARRHVRSTQQLTPNEAGRIASLAMRRRLAQKRAARRAVALRRAQKRTILRSASVDLLRARRETREAPATDAAASFLLLPGATSEVEETEPPSTHAETEAASFHVPRGAMPPPLRGSLASLERQNERLDAEGLERIEDEADLADRIAHKLLAPIPVSSALTVNPELPPLHRYCRPWTARFLADLAQAHDAAFHRPLKVNSAVRTVEYQARLMRINGNAAPAEGDIVSPHLTGATIDIAKDGMSRAEIAWMRRRLLALEMAGKIDVEEEFEQACFHITVYKAYAPPHAQRPAAEIRSESPADRRESAPDPSGTPNSSGTPDTQGQ